MSKFGGSPGESFSHRPTRELPTRELQSPDFDPATAEIPVEPYLIEGSGIHPDDLDDEWPQPKARRDVHLPVLTATMLALAVLAVGFWGGAVLERHHASSGGSSASSAFSALSNRFAAARAAGAATAGVVTAEQGNTLFVTNSSGNPVKVQVGPSTAMTRTTKSSLAGLQTGDTVIVQGRAGPSGTVTATSVRATAAGASGGNGFFGGTPGAGLSGAGSADG